MGKTGAMGKETAEESLKTQEIYKRMGQILPYYIGGLFCSKIYERARFHSVVIIFALQKYMKGQFRFLCK